MARRLFLIGVLLTFAACAPSIAPLTASTKDYGASDDEAFVIRQGEQVAIEVQRAGILLDDPDLIVYVREVGGRVTPADLGPGMAPRFHVVRCPGPNAFSLPQGEVYVCVGLLTSLENEAELAQILAHEIAHTVKRHALASLVGRHRKAAALQAFDIVTLGIGGGLAGVSYVLTVTRYERSQEEEADLVALGAVGAAGYDVAAASRLYQRLQDHPLFGPKVASLFNSHPAVTDRLQYVQQLIDSAEIPRQGTFTGAERFEAATAHLPAQQLGLLLDTKRFGEAQRYARQLIGERAGDAALYCLLAEAHRGLAEDPEAAALEQAAVSSTTLDDRLFESFAARTAAEAQSAAEQYDHCLSLDPQSAVGYRGLGLIALRRGDKEQARALLSRYLDVSPQAPDRRFVENLLDELGES